MEVKSAKDVGIGATVRIGHQSGQVVEDQVIARMGERLILQSGKAVDPRKQYVKVIGFGQFWRAVEEWADPKTVKQHGSAEDRLGFPAHQLGRGSWPRTGT